MYEITQSIRAILSFPKVYDIFQWAVGGGRGRSIVASRYIKSKNGDYVLDIGCGTAEIRRYLSAVEYFGIDPNADYVHAARNRFRHVPRCTFLCGTIDDATLAELPKFDIVLATGVLHHLSDEEALRVAKLAKSALKIHGRLVTLDPCVVEGQSPIAKFFVSRDRGRYVRDAKAYQTLMSHVFNSIAIDVRHDLARFPYTHLAMECMSK
jgi:SAM-dependent methyltransferase